MANRKEKVFANHTSDRETCVKGMQVANKHKRNGIQNHEEVVLYTIRMAKIKKTDNKY